MLLFRYKQNQIICTQALFILHLYLITISFPIPDCISSSLLIGLRLRMCNWYVSSLITERIYPRTYRGKGKGKSEADLSCRRLSESVGERRGLVPC